MKLSYHSGLSFRFFEGLYHEKKVITDNIFVKNYDFYHPDNIFITDYKKFDGLKEFLEKPYFPVDQKIVSKYGFDNWIRYVLNLPNYEPINLPVYRFDLHTFSMSLGKDCIYIW